VPVFELLFSISKVLTAESNDFVLLFLKELLPVTDGVLLCISPINYFCSLDCLETPKHFLLRDTVFLSVFWPLNVPLRSAGNGSQSSDWLFYVTTIEMRFATVADSLITSTLSVCLSVLYVKIYS
jgi:hypothetical protein